MKKFKFLFTQTKSKQWNRFVDGVAPKQIGQVKISAQSRQSFASGVAVALIIGIVLGVSPAARALFGMSRGGVTSNGGHSQRQPAALGDSAVAYYPFDDGANDKAPVNRNNLTDNNTVTQAAGRTPNSAQFTAASSEYLSITDNANLSISSTTDFTIAAWVYFDSVAGTQGIAGKWTDNNDNEYVLRLTSSQANLLVRKSNDSGSNSVTASTFGNLATGTWYFIVAYMDADVGLGISVNGGAIDTTAATDGGRDANSAFQIGAYNSTNFFSGRIDNVGFWKRTLTSGEREWLYNTGLGRGYSELEDSYKTSLQAYWDLNQPSGTRLDSHSTNNLTDNNTVTFAAGVNQTKAGKAAQLTAASSESLSVADNASISTGDIDFSVAGWFYFDSAADGVTRYLLTKDEPAPKREWGIYKNDTGSTIRFYVSNDGTNVPTTVIGPAMTESTWYFIVAWHDATANTINLQVNNGTVSSSSHTTGLSDTASGFRIGGYNGSSNFFGGRADNVAMWKRVLTTEERASLYNSGLGKDYRELSNQIKNNLTSWWDLDEPSGTRNDAHAYSGANNGTATSVTQTTGKFSNAYTFNGTSSQISVTDSTSLNPGSALTLSAWAKPNGASEAGYILAKGNGSTGSYWIYWDGANDYIQGVGDSGCNSNAVFTDNGEWVHIAIVNDNSTMTFYRNGVAAGSCSNGVNTTADNLVIGNRPGGTTAAHYFAGDIDDLRISSRALSAAEIARQFNGSKPAEIDNTAAAYYKMDEGSGTVAKDSARGSNNPNPLIDNNTVTQATGRQPNVGQFTAANSEYLSIADNTSLSTGDIDFSIAGWIYLDSKSSQRALATKYNSSTSNGEYALYYESAVDRFRFYASSDGASTFQTVDANTSLGSPSTGTWYFVVAWHDATANTINIQVNNGTADSAAWSNGVFDGAAQFRLGSLVGSGGANEHLMDGRIANVGFWKKVLTSTERTSLYNGGSGKMYQDLGTDEKTSLEAYWHVNEAGGTRNDSHSTNNLTDNNTVTTKPNSIYKDSDTAAQFTNANDESLTVADNAALSLTTTVSVSAWFYLDTNNEDGRVIVDKGENSFTIGVIGTNYVVEAERGKAFFSKNGVDNTLSTTTISTGQWYHLVVTHNNGTRKLYLNGTLETTSEGKANFADTASDLAVGGHLTAPTTWSMDGRLSNVGIWAKELSLEETKSLYYTGAGKNYNKLTVGDKDKLVSYWNLDEASGDRSDSQGGNTLTDNNTVTANSGVPSARHTNASSFASASSESLSATSNASLQTGNIDFTLAGWFLAADVGAARVMAGKDGPSNREWFMYFDQSGDNRFEFWIEDGANPGTFKTVVNSSGPAPTADTWYYIVAWHDATADTINIQVNNGTANSLATSGAAPNAGTAAFMLGGRAHADTYWNGRIDNFGFWKRTLTAGEKTALYNSGIGKSYSDLTGGEKQTLVSWWDMDESSGTRGDAHGGNSGLVSGVTVAKEGVFGNAYSFDGSDYVLAGDSASLDIAGAGTFSSWVKLSTLASNQVILAKGDSGSGASFAYGIQYDSGGFIRLITSSNGSTLAYRDSSSNLTTDTWYHIAGVYDGAGTLSVYINGVLKNGTLTGSIPSSLNNSAANLYLGANVFNTAVSGYISNGLLDDVRIYTRALTASEILDQYNAGAKQL